MKLPYFVSRRISHNESGSFSTVISRIAVISIAIALSALIGTYMILNGFQDTIKQKIYSFSGHLVLSKYTLSTSYEDSFIEVGDSLITGLQGLTGVDYLQTYAYKAGLLKTEEEVQGVILKGVDHRFDTGAFSKHIIKGHFPKFPDSGYGTEVAISSKVARYLELDVDDRVLVLFIQDPPRYRNLKITGIYETGLEDFDERMVLGDINLVRRMNNWDSTKVGGIEIFLQNPDKMVEMEDVLFRNTESDIYADKVSDKYVQVFEWLRLIDRNVVILFSIILFVAAFNMISILLILIMERTQMIGVLKALGASNQLIRRIFFVNGVQLITKGLLWGNAIGLLFCYIQYQFRLIPLDQQNYYMDHVPVKFDWVMVGMIDVLSVVVTAAALFIPLLIVSRISPIKSIRFD